MRGQVGRRPAGARIWMRRRAAHGQPSGRHEHVRACAPAGDSTPDVHCDACGNEESVYGAWQVQLDECRASGRCGARKLMQIRE